MALDEDAAAVDRLARAEARAPSTAVVFVHGMREKRPMENLDDFVKTALPPCAAQGEPTWEFYARPDVVTDSYEAHCYSTRPQQGALDAETGQHHTDIYEYNWPFLSTSKPSAGFGATALRLFLRRPANVPDSLFGMWRRVWIMLLAILLAIPLLFVAGYLLSSDVPGSIVGLISGAVVLLFWFGLLRFVVAVLAGSAVAAPLVSVARYLDASPQSHVSRRAIRGGLVDLLRDLHDGRHSRIIVVAHGVGAYIAYDALASLWAQTPVPKIHSMQTFDDVAGRLVGDNQSDKELDKFQNAQFTLRQDLRSQGNHWYITDFVTIGAPMALADLVVTRAGIYSGFKDSDLTHRRELFDALVARGVLVRCPPRSESLAVEAIDNRRRDDSGTLGFQSPFAVTRWTNMWFPVIRGSLHGDWFGGELRALFGPGIRDIPVRGNQPERLKRGSAHTEYFRRPDKGHEGDLAWHLRSTLALQTPNQNLRDS